MMARAKRIYILIIKVNKLFSFFLSRCFLKEIENMYSMFLLACVAGGISRASAFVLVEKPWTRVAKPWEDWWRVELNRFAAREFPRGLREGIWWLRRSLACSRIPPATQAMFLPSYTKACESLGELKKAVEHSPAACVPTAFLVLPNFHLCLYKSIKTWYMFFVSRPSNQPNLEVLKKKPRKTWRLGPQTWQIIVYQSNLYLISALCCTLWLIFSHLGSFSSRGCLWAPAILCGGEDRRCTKTLTAGDWA